jgi:disulfide bond formation protein DsbB
MIKEAAISSPPVAVAGASVLGYTLPEWASIVAIVYTLLLIWRFLRVEWKEWRNWWGWRE